MMHPKANMMHCKPNGGNMIPLPPALRNIQGKNAHPANTRTPAPGQPSNKGRRIVGR